MGETTDPARSTSALAERYLDRLNAHDLEGLLALYGARSALALNGDRHEGRDGLRGLFWMLFNDLPDLRVEVVRTFDAGPTTLTELTLRATRGRPARGGAAGRLVELPVCGLFHADEQGRLAEVALYFDGALLLRQMGRLPAAA